MTYRDDSDIRVPYGYFESLSDPADYPPIWKDINWIPYDKEEVSLYLKSKDKEFLGLAKKPKKVAWIVSNCKTASDREIYAKELKKYIEVDIFVSCGPKDSLKCSKNDENGTDLCTQLVENEYLFYLSFENSFCDQYVTEKFFQRMNQKAIPVVMGAGPYEKMAPEHSYINVDDFESPKALAQYLNHLSNNPEEYLSYFWWKEHYRVEVTRAARLKSFCQICQMLNDQGLPPKSYHNLNDWWKQSSHCKAKGSFKWSRPTNWIMDSLSERASVLLGKSQV